MSPARRRGRPPVYDDHHQTLYLKHIAEGATLNEAAATIGITPRGAAKWRQNPDFAHQLDTARTLGKKARAENLPHDEYRYIHHGCRCDLCTEAATTARTERRNRTTHKPDTTDNDTPATVVQIRNIPAQKGNPLPLARAS